MIKGFKDDLFKQFDFINFILVWDEDEKIDFINSKQTKIF